MSVFSIGVIHHLPDPPAGLKAIGKHVQPDGLLFAWVYGYENNGWIRNVVTPIRERITARLPRRRSLHAFLRADYRAAINPLHALPHPARHSIEPAGYRTTAISTRWRNSASGTPTTPS